MHRNQRNDGEHIITLMRGLVSVGGQKSNMNKTWDCVNNTDGHAN